MVNPQYKLSRLRTRFTSLQTRLQFPCLFDINKEYLLTEIDLLQYIKLNNIIIVIGVIVLSVVFYIDKSYSPWLFLMFYMLIIFFYMMNDHNQYCILERNFKLLIKMQSIRLVLLFLSLSILVYFQLFTYWYLFIALIVSHFFYFSYSRFFTEKNIVVNAVAGKRFNKFLFPIYFSANTMELSLTYWWLLGWD